MSVFQGVINIILVFQTFPLVEAEQRFYALNVEIVPGLMQSKLDAPAKSTSMCT